MVPKPYVHKWDDFRGFSHNFWVGNTHHGTPLPTSPETGHRLPYRSPTAGTVGVWFGPNQNPHLDGPSIALTGCMMKNAQAIQILTSSDHSRDHRLEKGCG